MACSTRKNSKSKGGFLLFDMENEKNVPVLNVQGIKRKDKIPFRSFSSITVVNEKTVEKVTNNYPDIQQWIAMEKVHGANFSVCFAQGELLAGKRSGFIAENENFHDHMLLLECDKEFFSFAYEYVKEHWEEWKGWLQRCVSLFCLSLC